VAGLGCQGFREAAKLPEAVWRYDVRTRSVTAQSDSVFMVRGRWPSAPHAASVALTLSGAADALPLWPSPAPWNVYAARDCAPCICYTLYCAALDASACTACHALARHTALRRCAAGRTHRSVIRPVSRWAPAGRKACMLI